MNPESYLGELFGLAGRVAVVIGGTGELCGAMAEGLAAAGAETVLVGRDAGKAQRRLERIAAAGGKGWFHAAEASSPIETAAACTVVVKDADCDRTKRPIVFVHGTYGSGANFENVAALLGMLTSCASGVTVVNIDNGFGAAFAAARILRAGEA